MVDGLPNPATDAIRRFGVVQLRAELRGVTGKSQVGWKVVDHTGFLPARVYRVQTIRFGTKPGKDALDELRREAEAQRRALNTCEVVGHDLDVCTHRCCCCGIEP